MSDDEMSSDEEVLSVQSSIATNGTTPTPAASASGGGGEDRLMFNGIKDPVIIEQAQALLADFGPDARSLTLMINARRGEPFAPLSGYVLRVAKSAKVVARHIDAGTLFKARSLVPLFNFEDKETAAAVRNAKMDGFNTSQKILEAVTPEWMVNTTADCFATAYAVVNDAYHRGDHGGKTRLMEMEPSESCQSSISIVETVRDLEMWLVCEMHSVPKMWFVGDAIATAEREGQTLSEFFFQERMREYYKSQKAVRTIALRLMRARIVRQVFGDEVASKLRFIADPTNLDSVNDYDNGVSHFVTNVGISDDTTEDFIFFSEALEAELGALISAGPFREMIWANSHQKSTRSIQEAGRAHALPFDMPTSFSRTKALEAVILVNNIRQRRARSTELGEEPTESRGAAQFARIGGGTEESKIEILWRNEHSASVISVQMDFIAGPSFDNFIVGGRMAQHAQQAKCILAWRESSLKLPVAIPDEAIEYRMGAEVGSLLSALSKHGVDLNREGGIDNPTLRIVIQALGPVNTIDQLAMWRAAQSALLRPM